MNADSRGTLIAVMHRILPSDDGPGAVEAGVDTYAAAALDHRAFRGGVVEWVEQNLQALEKQARALHGKILADCDPAQQDALIEARSDDQALAGREFLNLMVGIGLEGFLGDPAHGGNLEQVGWAYIGFEPRDPLAGFSLADFDRYSSSESRTSMENSSS